jgi:Beta-carotene 15,15'-dioxygenase
MLSQVSFYKKLWPNFTIKDYYQQAAPYTILAVVGFVLMINGHQYILPGVSIVSTFLVFIACITLPHIIFVEESYN